jgi:hypothetical protein
VQKILGLIGIGLFDPGLDLIKTVKSGSDGWERLAARGGGTGRWRRGASENRVNAIPAMISAQVWLGRKRARRGTCLGA